MLKKRLVMAMFLSGMVLNQTALGNDFGGWFSGSKAQQQPAQQQQQVAQQQQPYNNDSRINQQINPDNSNLEKYMDQMNRNADALSKIYPKSNQNIAEINTSSYINTLQMIIINEATKKLDGMDNKELINSNLSEVASCQKKHNLNTVAEVNARLNSEQNLIVQNYLRANSSFITANKNECVF